MPLFDLEIGVLDWFCLYAFNAVTITVCYGFFLCIQFKIVGCYRTKEKLRLLFCIQFKIVAIELRKGELAVLRTALVFCWVYPYSLIYMKKVDIYIYNTQLIGLTGVNDVKVF